MGKSIKEQYISW